MDDDSVDGASPLVWSVESLLSAAECVALIARFEEIGCAPAPINSGGGFEMRPDVRNNARVMFDDETLARSLYAKLLPELPPRMFSEGLTPCGLNERFRGYRYHPGERFRPHYDGSFRRSAAEQSLLTFMVYLNDDCEGGATRFLDLDLEVAPRTGHALLFQHAQRHEGSIVTAGAKYVLRSDVMYRRP